MKAAAAIAIACAAYLPALAQDTLTFGDLEGRWSGTGEFEGAPSIVTAEFAPTLDGAFWTLSYTVTSTRDGAAFKFAGQAFYPADPTAGADGRWFDVRGMSLPMAHQFENDAMIADWTEGETQGRSIYELAGGVLSVRDGVVGNGGLQAFAAAELTREQTAAEIVDELYSAFNAHDLDAMWSLYANDAVHVSPTSPEGWDGEAKFRKVYGGLFEELPNLRDDIVSVVVDGDRAAVRFIASWDSPDGRIELPIAGFITVRNGKIVEDITYFDQSQPESAARE